MSSVMDECLCVRACGLGWLLVLLASGGVCWHDCDWVATCGKLGYLVTLSLSVVVAEKLWECRFSVVEVCRERDTQGLNCRLLLIDFRS